MAEGAAVMATDVTYQLIAVEQFEEVLTLCNGCVGPLSKCLGCNLESPKRNENLKRRIMEGLSWCAVDNITGEMVAVRLASGILLNNLPDTPVSFEEHLKNGSSKEQALISVFNNSLLDMKQLMLDYQETKMIVLYGLHVLPSYRGKGIASELVRRSLAHGVELGYTFAGVACISYYSQRIYESLEFDKVKEIKYESYIDPVTNTRLFKDVEYPHKSAIGYVKKL